MRKSDCRACCGHALRRSGHVGATFAAERTAHGGNDPARPVSGNVVLFEEALAELSGISIDRVTAYIHDKNISGFRALYREAGLPDVAYPAFREALSAMRAGLLIGEQGGASRLSGAWSNAYSTPARMSGREEARHCWLCCGVSRSKPHAKRLGCSATIWSQTHASFRPISLTQRRSSWRQPSYSFAGTIEGLWSCSRTSGTVAIFVAQEFIRHFTQPSRQLTGELLGVRTCIFTVDRAHRVHVLLDQFTGGIVRVRAYARSAGTGCQPRRNGRKAKRCRFALDVMRGVKQRVHVGIR